MPVGGWAPLWAPHVTGGDLRAQRQILPCPQGAGPRSGLFSEILWPGPLVPRNQATLLGQSPQGTPWALVI